MRTYISLWDHIVYYIVLELSMRVCWNEWKPQLSNVAFILFSNSWCSFEYCVNNQSDWLLTITFSALSSYYLIFKFPVPEYTHCINIFTCMASSFYEEMSFLTFKTSLTPPFVIEMPTPGQESEQSCIGFFYLIVYSTTFRHKLCNMRTYIQHIAYNTWQSEQSIQ